MPAPDAGGIANVLNRILFVRAVIAEKREMLLSEISKSLLTTRGNRQKAWTRSRTRFAR
jgi:hypothetical protein